MNLSDYSYTLSPLTKMTPKEVLQRLEQALPGLQTEKIYNGTGEESVRQTYKGNSFRPLIYTGDAAELMIDEGICSEPYFVDELQTTCRLAVTEDEEGRLIFSSEWPDTKLGFRMSIIEVILMREGQV